MNLNKASKFFITTVLFLLMSLMRLKAQGIPCGDPDIDCPIDAPVIFLAAVILFLSVKKIAEVKRA